MLSELLATAGTPRDTTPSAAVLDNCAKILAKKAELARGRKGAEFAENLSSAGAVAEEASCAFFYKLSGAFSLP